MADRPIIFSAPMVRALLGGRKTQTRRLVTPGTCEVLGSRVTAKSPAWTGLRLDEAVARKVGPLGTLRPHLDVPWQHPEDAAAGRGGEARYRVDPIIQAGDRLYVRENHALVPSSAYRMSEGVQQTINPNDRDLAAIYAAGWDRSKPRWRPSIHMPRWASRLTLLVTDVRVERLQDISEADAIDEGALTFDLPTHGAPTERGQPPLGQAPSQRFRHLWNSINGPEAWAANPWICAVSFRCIQQNIDTMEKAA
ncbi:hypothetical protein ACLBYG_22110 [Methylobacterium sp. D53M]